MLELEPQNLTEDWEKASKALEDEYNRTVDIKNSYGVLDFKKWMPYTTMLVPLVSAIDWIKTYEELERPENYEKLDQWYWYAVFSNRHDQAVETTSYNDFKAIKAWLKDNR